MNTVEQDDSRCETPMEGREERSNITPLPAMGTPEADSRSPTPTPHVTKAALASLMDSVSVLRGDLLNLRLGVQAHVAENELWVLKMMRVTKKALSAGLRRRSSASRKAIELQKVEAVTPHEEATDDEITNQIGSLLRASEHLSPPPVTMNESSLRTCSSATSSPQNDNNAQSVSMTGQVDMPSIAANRIGDEAPLPLEVRGIVSHSLAAPTLPQAQQRTIALQQFDDHIRRLEENVVANAVHLRKKFEDSQDALRKMRPAGSTPQHTFKTAPQRSALSSAASERQTTLSIAYYGGVHTMPNQQHSWAMPPTIIPTATKITLPTLGSSRANGANDRAAVNAVSAEIESFAAVDDTSVPLPTTELTAVSTKTAAPPKRKPPPRLGEAKSCAFEDSLFGHQVQVQGGRSKCNPAEAVREPSPPVGVAINVPTTTNSSEDLCSMHKSRSPRPQKVFNGRVVKVSRATDRVDPPGELVPKKPEMQQPRRLVVRSQRKPITAKASPHDLPVDHK